MYVQFEYPWYIPNLPYEYQDERYKRLLTPLRHNRIPESFIEPRNKTLTKDQNKNKGSSEHYTQQPQTSSGSGSRATCLSSADTATIIVHQPRPSRPRAKEKPPERFKPKELIVYSTSESPTQPQIYKKREKLKLNVITSPLSADEQQNYASLSYPSTEQYYYLKESKRHSISLESLWSCDEHSNQVPSIPLSRSSSLGFERTSDLKSKETIQLKGVLAAIRSPYQGALSASKPVYTGNVVNVVDSVPSPTPESPTTEKKSPPFLIYEEFEAYPSTVKALPQKRDENNENLSKNIKKDSGGAKRREKNINRGIRMGKMNPLEDHERKVIIEFCHLLEKSKQLFNGLRELPQYGHQQWHSFFGRTFDVYTKLWKFQQQHRSVLDSKYGLKRWQIGEIASKIGQLYYHFYLRTSETAYLTEAFSFYYAIRGRCYYTKACKEDKCELMVKKLRYYARFIVVCLLLKKIKLVRELTKELDRQIVEYGNTYDPDDQIEWTVVVDEVKAFVQADPVVSVVHPDNYPVILSHRLTGLNMPPVERSSSMTLSLQEALIIGSTSQQVRFSELTIDMFRMLQSLEREPSDNAQHLFDESPRQRFVPTPSAPINKGYNMENGPRRENPHKYLLYKPSPMQMLVYLSNGCHDLPPNGALLLYISADGQIVHQAKHGEDVGYDIGGLITTSKNDIYRECSRNSESKPGASSKHKELQCLHPGDLSPFTRRPMFIIIDSDNSYVFQHVPRHFGQPLVILMSPLDLPATYQSERKQQGSLFTLFLHAPLAAFCYISDIHNLSLVTWDRGMVYVDTFLAEASQLLTRSRIDPMYLAFMGDDFLRLFILRFIFCEVTLRLHRGFRSRTQLTRASPPLPEDIYDHPSLVHVIMDLANHLQVRGHFHDPSAGPPPAKE